MGMNRMGIYIMKRPARRKERPKRERHPPPSRFIRISGSLVRKGFSRDAI
jgi:hypothetical protein